MPLSVDSISSGEKTVWSEVVLLAFSLSAILGVITAALFQRAADITPRRPVFPGLVLLGLEQAVLLLGACVVLAVLWQRYAGTVLVGPVAAALLVAAAHGSARRRVIVCRAVRCPLDGPVRPPCPPVTLTWQGNEESPR